MSSPWGPLPFAQAGRSMPVFLFALEFGHVVTLIEPAR
jgi:hypothetical protein